MVPRTVRLTVKWFIVLTMVASCRIATGPTEKFVGIYELDLVNGRTLPAAINTTTGCSRSVTSGNMSLSGPGVNLRSPLYAWGVSASESCGSATPNPLSQAFDAGVWSTDGENLFLEPRWDRSYPPSSSSYRGTGNTDVSPVTVELSFAGNTYRFKYVSLYPTP